MNGLLTLIFSATVLWCTVSVYIGSFTANTPAKVTLPTFASQGIVTGISSASASQPTFTGTGASLKADFTGTPGTATGSVTPQVKVTSSFTGNQATITAS